MQPLPHHYAVTACASPNGDVHLGADGIPALLTATPPEFDGPDDRWSPETLLVAAVADCFALTFRGIARNSKLLWSSFECDATGTLDRVGDAVRFTDVHLHASLTVPPETSVELATRVLEKAEQRCLVSRSLNASVHLESRVTVRRLCCV